MSEGSGADAPQPLREPVGDARQGAESVNCQRGKGGIIHERPTVPGEYLHLAAELDQVHGPFREDDRVVPVLEVGLRLDEQDPAAPSFGTTAHRAQYGTTTTPHAVPIRRSCGKIPADQGVGDG